MIERVREHPVRAAWLGLGALLLLRLIAAAVEVGLPGVQYDEALFVNAAREQLPGIFIYKEVLGLPTQLMPYIGALKAWLYTPVFWVVDPSPAALRLPMVLLTSLALLFAFEGVRRLADLPAAVATTVLLAADASLFWFTRDDVGPTAIGFFLKCTALLAVALLVRTGRTRWAVVLVLVVGAGVFNKLNFIWIVNAAILVALPFAVRNRRWLAEHRGATSVLAVGLPAVYAGFVWWSLTIDLAAQQGGLSTLEIVEKNLPLLERGTSSVLTGSAFEQLAAGQGTPGWALGITLAVLSVAAIPLALRGPGRAPAVAALTALWLLIVPQALVTDQATAPWHYLEIYPFLHVGLAWTLTMPWRMQTRARPWLIGATIVIAAAGVFQVARTASTMRHLAGGSQTPIWSPEIYALSDAVDRRSGSVIVTDWGIANQLIAFDEGPGFRIHEEAFAAEGANDRNGRFALAQRAFAAPGPVYVVTRGPETVVFPSARANTIATFGRRLRNEATFRDETGRVMFQLWRLDTRPG
jgi:4-amino-4-deoxy-L-arabinose transferase-like glycosyltransferase